MAFVRRYILDNSYFDHNVRGSPYSPSDIFGPFGKLKGYAWVSQPFEGYGNIVYVTRTGRTRQVFNALMDWLDGSNFAKYVFDKWIEVRPSSGQFYQTIMGQKYDLQARVKQALISISQSVSDLELLEHDIRKYQEFENYLRDAAMDVNVSDKKKREELIKRKKLAQMALKTIFVDQVDYHAGGTGQGPGRLSMAFMRNNNIMPTIVDDFMAMESIDDIESGPLKNLQTVEKNMLRVKWKLYEEWLKTFRNEVERRLSRLNQLKRSREKTLEQFREWAKPLIVREMAIRDGFSDEANRLDVTMRLGNEYESLGEPVSMTFTNVIAFKRLSTVELQKTPSELIQKQSEEVPEITNIYDELTKILIFDENVGLRVKYPWITPAWVNSVKGWCLSQVKKKMLSGYSQYLIMTNVRFFTKTTTYRNNFEVETGVYAFDNFMVTPNIMFVKMVEFKAREEEVRRYINQMLGIKDERKTLRYTVVDGKYKVLKSSEKPAKQLGDNEFSSYDELLARYPDSDYKIEFIPQKDKESSLKKIFNLDFDFLLHKFPMSGSEFHGSDYDKYIFKQFKKRMGMSIYFRPTPYEKDFFDRIAQFHMVNVGISAGVMRGVVKKAMGVPGG